MENLEEAVIRAQNGDFEAFTTLVHRFQDMAYGYAYWYCGDFHLSEDIAQSTFFEAYCELAKLKEPAAFVGWFRRILNKNCDRQTRGKKISTVGLEAAVEHSDTFPEPGNHFEKLEMEASVTKAIKSLPENERKTVILFYVGDYTQLEVAEFLDIPETTVNSRLYSARQHLKERVFNMVEKELKDHALPKDFGENFNPAIAEMLRLCRERFGENLKAVWLTGSISVGEALVGKSNVNWFMFLENDPSENDSAWIENTKEKIANQFPTVGEVLMNLYSLDRLRKERFWRFIIRYNSVQLHGEDVLTELEKEGFETPEPSKKFAQSRTAFAKKCIDSAVKGKLTPELTVLPVDPFLSSRILVRYFVIIEGAYLLMAEDKFTSFRQDEVLNQLQADYPEWKEVLDMTEKILKDPKHANILPDTVVEKVAPFVYWILDKISK